MPATERVLTAVDVAKLASGSLCCDRATWTGRFVDCTPQTPCPLHEQVYQALRELAQLKSLAEGVASAEQAAKTYERNRGILPPGRTSRVGNRGRKG
jgi:hypothetical protein